VPQLPLIITCAHKTCATLVLPKTLVRNATGPPRSSTARTVRLRHESSRSPAHNSPAQVDSGSVQYSIYRH
jgi:hypothetical protein